MRFAVQGQRPGRMAWVGAHREFGHRQVAHKAPPGRKFAQLADQLRKLPERAEVLDQQHVQVAVVDPGAGRQHLAAAGLAGIAQRHQQKRGLLFAVIPVERAFVAAVAPGLERSHHRVGRPAQQALEQLGRGRGHLGAKTAGSHVEVVLVHALALPGGGNPHHVHRLGLPAADLLQRGVGLQGQPQRAGKVVGAAQRHNAQRRTLFPGKTHQAVDHFVDRTVAAAGNHVGGAVIHGRFGKHRRVPGFPGGIDNQRHTRPPLLGHRGPQRRIAGRLAVYYQYITPIDVAHRIRPPRIAVVPIVAVSPEAVRF